MATAPRPGKNAAASSPSYYRVTVKDRTLEVPTEVTIQEKFALRAATGVSFEGFFGATVTSSSKFGLDSLCVLWWLARRHNGEPNLQFEKHLQEWPADLTPDDIDLTLVDDDEGDSDDPEGSGPA